MIRNSANDTGHSCEWMNPPKPGSAEKNAGYRASLQLQRFPVFYIVKKTSPVLHAQGQESAHGTGRYEADGTSRTPAERTDAEGRVKTGPSEP